MNYRIAFILVVVTSFSCRVHADYSLDYWAKLQDLNEPNVKVTTTDFATPWPDRVSLGKNGFLMVSTGSFGMFDIFKMCPDGACTFVFFDHDAKPSTWRKASFHVSADDVNFMLGALNKLGLNRLHKSYSVPVEDGEQAFFSISDGSKPRTVWMDNTFPPEFQKIINLVRDQIAAHHLNLDSAPTSTHEECRALYHEALPQ